jgi:hypothetical protein
LLWLFVAPWAWAGQYVLLAGQTQTVPVAVRVVNGETRCNLRISVPGQADVERVVQALLSRGDDKNIQNKDKKGESHAA